MDVPNRPLSRIVPTNRPSVVLVFRLGFDVALLLTFSVSKTSVLGCAWKGFPGSFRVTPLGPTTFIGKILQQIRTYWRSLC
jgi:hypothetical protein